MISRVCEEFGCLPSAAIRELEQGEPGLVFDVMDLRAYARAKEAIAQAQKPADVPESPYVDRVFEVQAELLRRRNARNVQREQE